MQPHMAITRRGEHTGSGDGIVFVVTHRAPTASRMLRGWRRRLVLGAILVLVVAVLSWSAAHRQSSDHAGGDSATTSTTAVPERSDSPPALGAPTGTTTSLAPL